MRKITLLLAFCTITTLAMAYPQVLPIDYTQFFATTAIGTSPNLEKGVYATTGDAIMANQWNRSGKLSSGEGAGVSPLVENSTLNYSNYIDNNVSKAILLDPNIQPVPAISATFRTTVYSLTSLSTDYTGTYYVGMLVNFSTVVSSGVDFLAMDANHTGNSQRGRVFVKNSATAGFYNMGVGFSGTSDIGASGNTGTWSANLAFGTTYFIVLKYVTAPTGGTEIASLFINPIPGETEAATTSFNNSVSAVSALKSIKGFIIRQRPNIGGKLAGIRFSDNWADVVKASPLSLTQLSTPTVGSATLIGDTGFTANWTTIANASGYDVKVYLGSNLVSTTNFAGQATTVGAVTGLMSGLTYTFKVIAKGDGLSYSDSELSLASSNVSTLDPYASNAINTDFGNVSWGDPFMTQPISGSYTSSSLNGFDLNAAMLYTTNGVAKGIKGESHTNRIAIDKITNGGKVTFPTVNSVEQIEIHATAGTAGNGFQLKEFDAATNTWNSIGGTYVYDANSKTAGTDSIYIIPISRSVPTKFRIENPTNGGIYLLQVITRTTNPALLAKPTVSAASGISSTGFTANWTAVANATGYKVRVYQAGTEITNSPFSANGQATESLSIADLIAETAYSFKVQAIGDGDVNFSDSFLSFAGLVTTSIGTSLDELNTSNFAIVSGKKISFAEAGSVSIFSLQGAQVYQAKNVNSVDTNLATGLYILQFTNNVGKQLIQKISIK